jgi:hypothetical protein
VNGGRRSLLALALGLAACTRPAPVPSSFDLATSIAATLTSLPTLAPSATLPPSPTGPPSATPSITPSPVPSETPTPGATPTPTLPPLPTDDPRFGLDLNVPGYHDGFEQRFTWGELSSDGAVNTWDSGHLQAVDKLVDPYIWWSATVPDVFAGDFYVEVTATIQACQGRDSSGLAGRVSGANLDGGYALEVSCDGAYRLRRFVGGRVDVLRDWTSAEAIHPGPNAENRLGLLARGTRLYAFANRTRLGEAVEDSSLSAGTFGLYAMARETPGLTVVFDDFALWYVTR